MVGLRRHRRVEPPAPVEEVVPHEAASPEPVSEGPAAPPTAGDSSDASRGRGFLHAVPAVDEADPEADPGVEREADGVFDQDQEEETAAETADAETTHAELPDADDAQPSEAPLDAHVADAEPDDDAGDGTVAVTDDEPQAAEEDRAIDDADVDEAERADVADDVELDEAELDEAEVETVARRPLEVRVGALDGPILDPESLPDAAGAVTVPFELPRVIAIANQKGGVGKTTTAVNLGAALAELDFRVLVLDLDPQGNATTGLGINPRDVEGSVYDVLLNDVPLEDVVEPTTLRNLFVAPATIDLAGAEIELVPVMSRELRLKRAIDQVRPDYDIVMIDCPPSLGLLTVNGLAAADDVIVPIQCEYYALEGLGQLLRNVGLVQSNLNQSLDVRGIILTMYDARTKLADQVESEVRNYFGPKVYRTVVPRTVRLSEAPSFGQPIIVFDSTSRGASAYRDLAKEVSRGATKRAR
jgi:chromosome partitioning protein